MLCLYALFAFLLLQNAPDAVAPPQVDLPDAVVNARVTTAPGETLESATVLMRGGRFVAVGKDVPLPPGTRVFDAAGMDVYPGFIDVFTRTGVTGGRASAEEERRTEDEFEPILEGPRVSMELANRNGIAARRSVTELIDLTDKTYESARLVGFTSGLVAPPRGILGGRAAVVSFGGEPLRRSVVLADACQTASFVPPGARVLSERGRYPSTVFAVIALMRQTMWDADWYADMLAHAAKHPELAYLVPVDEDLKALQAIRRGQPLYFEANDLDEILRAIKLSKELRFKLVIVGGREAYKCIDALKAAGATVVATPRPAGNVPEWKLDARTIRREAGDASLLGGKWDKRPFQPVEAYEEAKRLRELEIKNLSALEAAGIPWTLSTLSGSKPEDLMTAIRESIEAGLSANAALAALTTRSADLLGLPDELGRIAIGKRANLTILTHPFGEKDAKLRAVYVDGRRFESGDAAASAPREERGGRGRGGRRGGQREGSAAREDSPPASAPASTPQSESASAPASDHASQPATESAPASAPEDLVRLHKPDWPIETNESRAPGFQTGGSVLLKHALVLTVSGQDLPATSVLVQNGKIAQIGKDLAAPPGCLEIDCTGYVLMPGVIDGHAHIALDSVNEGTLSVTCEVRCEDVVQSEDVDVYRALAGGVTAMHLMHGSANTIGGQCVLVKLKYGKTADEMIIQDRRRTVKFATGENVIRGGKPIPRQFQECAGERPRRFPGTRMGVETTMRRALQAGKNYAAAKAAFERDKAAGKEPLPFRRDIRLETLAEIAAGEIWINSHCYRADEILRLLAVAEDFGVRVANLHHCLEAYRIIPEIVRHGCGTVTFADWWAYKVEAYDAVPQNAGMLLRAGVNSTIKSDSSDLMRHLPLEAAKCMKYSGLTANEALRLVTLNVARQFDLAKRSGSIEVGKDADLALWDGHPLNTFSKCVLTLVEGEAYFRHPDFDIAKPEATDPQAASVQLPPQTGTANPVQAATGKGLRESPPRWPVDTRVDGEPCVAIAGATIHPISEPAYEGTLVIRGERILSVGRNVEIPKGAGTIAAKGLHVYPGLINAATNVGLREVEQVDITVDLDETGTFLPDIAAVSAFNPNSDMIEVTRAEGITSALVLGAVNTVSGEAGFVHLAGWTMNQMVATPKLAMLMALPSKRPDPIVDRSGRPDYENWRGDQQRGGPQRGGAALEQIEEFVRSARLYADARGAGGENAPPLDTRYEAMIPYVRGEKPVLVSADSYKQILEAILFADAQHLRLIVLGGREAWKLADLLAERQIPVIYEGVFAGPAGIDGIPGATEAWDANYRAPAVMNAAGVKFCFGVRTASLAKLAPIHAGFAIAHGLDPDVAVRALTLDAAEILGVSDSVGSLEPGKLANVIVTTDHPCQATNVVRYIFIRGRFVPLDSAHTRDAEKFAGRPIDTPLPPERTDLNGPPSQSAPRGSR